MSRRPARRSSGSAALNSAAAVAVPGQTRQSGADQAESPRLRNSTGSTNDQLVETKNVAFRGIVGVRLDSSKNDAGPQPRSGKPEELIACRRAGQRATGRATAVHQHK